MACGTSCSKAQGRDIASINASQIARKRAHVVHGNDKEEQSRVVSQYLQIVEWSAAIVTAESTADWAHVPPVLHCLVVGVQVEVARPRLKSPHTQSQDDDCLHRLIDRLALSAYLTHSSL